MGRAVPAKTPARPTPRNASAPAGKHNDLEDVGLDTYHHTFFEMLGNWSFGDYFKREANRLGVGTRDRSLEVPEGAALCHRLQARSRRPQRTRQEAWDILGRKIPCGRARSESSRLFTANKKDNFWMMGDTGPCGPWFRTARRPHAGRGHAGKPVNKGDARCIEIWNLGLHPVQRQSDGTFTRCRRSTSIPAWVFERVTSIIQGTGGFQGFQEREDFELRDGHLPPIF